MKTLFTPRGARRPLLTTLPAALAAVAWVLLSLHPLAVAAAAPHFNAKGNILIADQFNNRVLEVDPSGTTVATWGDGSSIAGPSSFVAPNDCERVGGLTLIAATGAPAGTEDSCPNGCPDNRVVLVNKSGKIVWSYGQAGITGSEDNQLNAPVQATYMPNANVLITDQGNQRVIEVNKKGKIVWQQGITGVAGSGFNELDNPNSAEFLKNGNYLIADEGNNRVIEVDVAWNVVWKADVLGDGTTLNAPAFASRLPNGNTLISDGGNNRAVEVDSLGNVAWQYVTTARPGSVVQPAPSRAVRLKNGNTLISDQFNDQVIEVNPAGTIVWSYGSLGEPGRGARQLDAPYDAKIIGDYTGLTRPPAKQNGGSGGSGGGGGYMGGGY